MKRFLGVSDGMVRSFMVAGLGILVLGSCSSVPDAINPVSWYEGVASLFDDDEPALEAEPAAAESGAEEPFPSLGTVPEAPEDAPAPEEFDQIAQGLAADSENAQYTNAEIRRADDEVGDAGTTLAQTAPAPEPEPQPEPQVTESTVEAPAATVVVAQAAPAPAQPLSSSTLPETTSPAVPVQPLGGDALSVAAPAATPVAAGTPSGSVRDMFAAAFQASGATTLAEAGLPASSVAARALPLAPAPDLPGAIGAPGRQVATVYFGDGSSRLSRDAEATLLEVAYAYGATGGPIRIVGHASQGGGSSQSKLANLDVSRDRAVAVAQALVGLGVPTERMTIEAASDTRPVAGGAAEERRVEIYLGG
ncbi:MAG: OmpA family protein [Alphaproteobacteria bacterium]